MVSRTLLFPVALLLAGLAGCASVPADWGRSDVAQIAADRGRAMPQIPDAKAFTSAALSRPLTPETAVQLALVNNPAVRVEAARLGVAAADVYNAGRLANPVFSGTRLSPGDSGAAHAQLTLGIAFSFVNLLFLPATSRYAGAQFEAAKLSVASSAVNLAADVEARYYDAVGAEQMAQLRATVAKSARASADLAQRYFDAGNISRRELAMEQAAASQAQLDALSARAAAVGARSDLNRLMGLSAAQDTWSLDARLAEPLKQEDELEALLRLAADSRLDVAAARKNAEALAAFYRLERRTRAINGIEVGVERERDFDASINVGPTVQLELPLFNWGGGRTAAALAGLQQAEAELDGLVIDSGNAVKLAQAQVLSAKARAESYRDALIPHLEAVVAEAQKEQNFMFIGIFEVILARQQEYDAYAGYLEAVRDYWTARTELSRAVGRRLPSSDQPAEPTLDPAQLIKPKSGGMDHSQHSMGAESQDMKDSPAMEGMDMKDKPATEGMDHGKTDASKPFREATDDAGPDCAAMKDMDMSKVDPSVAKAMQERCKGAGKSGVAVPGAAPAKPDPHVGHNMSDMPMKGMDHDTPKSSEPAKKPEAPHAH